MKRSPPGLFARLLLLTLPVESVILVLFGVWLVRGIERRDLASFDANLKVQSQELLGGSSLDQEGDLRPGTNSKVLVPGTLACILNGEGRILWEYPQGWFHRSGLGASSHGPVNYLQTIHLEDGTFRIFDRAYRTLQDSEDDPNEPAGPLIEVILAGPLSGLDGSNKDFREKAVGTGVALLALTGLLLWVAIKAGLSPATALMRRLQDIPGPSGMGRLDKEPVPLELRPLAREINGLLDRLWGMVKLQERFTAEAAHELRTPLTLVKSTLQTALLTGVSPEDHKQALLEALEDLDRLEKTAESLLDRARLDALLSPSQPIREQICLHELLKGEAGMFSPTAREKSIKLTLDLEPCTIEGDRTALQRLFANLLDNALAYSKHGGTVTLRCAACEGSVEAAVEDDGPAIPEEEHAHLFEHFFRGASGGAGGVPGAGLGLSIAAAIAHQHCGEITYERWGQEGNRFVVRFDKKEPE